MAQPNYQYEKRQKDLAKKKRREEKQQRKSLKTEPASTEMPVTMPDEQKKTSTHSVGDA